jgi:hypothetical protein
LQLLGRKNFLAMKHGGLYNFPLPYFYLKLLLLFGSDKKRVRFER